LGWNNVIVQVPQSIEQKTLSGASVGSSSVMTSADNTRQLLDLIPVGALNVVVYIAKVIIDYGTFVLLIVMLSVLRAPFIAFRLIRRNRQIGRDIYRELAQGDRFMDIWNAETPMLSDESQYHWAFVPNGNRQAANLNRIDQELAKLKLIELIQQPDSSGYIKQYAQRHSGVLVVRNSLIYAFVLFLRVTFLGDRFSHIASGNGRLSVRGLQRIYWGIIALTMMIPVFILMLIGKLIS
jgi:hypothetical protein